MRWCGGDGKVGHVGSAGNPNRWGPDETPRPSCPKCGGNTLHPAQLCCGVGYRAHTTGCLPRASHSSLLNGPRCVTSCAFRHCARNTAAPLADASGSIATHIGAMSLLEASAASSQQEPSPSTAAAPAPPAQPRRRRVEYFAEESFSGADLSRHFHIGWGVAGGGCP